MAVVMCGKNAQRQEYARIVIVGGGCYGSFYVRQLVRARDVDALSFDQLVVVDRDPQCRVAREWEGDSNILVKRQEWERFFDEYLGAAADSGASTGDAIVPSPLMPHLMFDWLVRRARARWPLREVERRGLRRAPHIPWQRAVPSGTHVVSFAEWICPVNCVEPAMCPVIKGPRTWTMPAAVRAYVEAERRGGVPLAGPVIFHCEHRAYGVGMFDTQAVLEGDALVARAAANDAADILVGTVSHCHGALDVLHVGRGHAA
jgi:hypothetical protein